MIRLDRFWHVAQRDFQNLSQPEGQLDDLSVAVRQADLTPHDVHQLGPALGPGVEAIERLQSVLAIGLGLADPSIGRNGLVEVMSFFFVDAGQAQQHLGL